MLLFWSLVKIFGKEGDYHFDVDSNRPEDAVEVLTEVIESMNKVRKIKVQSQQG